MTWFRLDDKGAHHAKVVAAGNEAYGAWVRAGQWSSDHRTDGMLPLDVALSIAPKRIWKRLLERVPLGHKVGLLEPADGGYQIHDFLDFNPSAAVLAEEEREKREQKQAAGRLGGLRSGVTRRAAMAPPVEAKSKQEVSTTEAGTEAEPEQNEAPIPIPIPIPIPPDPPPPPAGAREGDHPDPGEVAQVLGVTAEPPDHPAPRGSDLAEAILGALQRFPVFADIARLEVAEELAFVAFDRKRSPADAAACVAEAAAKEGPRAAAAGKYSPGDVAKFVSSCIASGPRAARSGGGSAGPSSSALQGLALALWRRVYAASHRRYGSYVSTTGDERIAADLAAQAETKVAEELSRRREAGDDVGSAADTMALTEEVLTFWFKGYLAEEGVRNYLVEARHPLAKLAGFIPTVGTPWSRVRTVVKRAPALISAADEPGAVAPPQNLLDFAAVGRKVRPA